MIEQFKQEVADNIRNIGNDPDFRRRSIDWLNRSAELRYSYNFAALGRPVIQYPQDIVAMQELIWQVRPDLIIETGIAHGGSLIGSAAMLALLDMTDAIEQGVTLDPRASKRKVIGIDIDIRPHNRQAIEAHPMYSRIGMLQGSSIDDAIVNQVHDIAKSHEKVLVCLDSNHTHQHVLEELEAYAPLVSKGSYCVVFDTVIDDMPENAFPNRSWGKGNNPKTAVHEYLRRLAEEGRTGVDGAELNLIKDKALEHKISITVAPDGFLYRI
jgi:cephalosporin hydroxylase